MKLEFLGDGAPDCPLIRLYAFERSEATRFKDTCDALSTGRLQERALHSEPWVQPVANCELYLRIGERDQGILGLKSPIV